MPRAALLRLAVSRFRIRRGGYKSFSFVAMLIMVLMSGMTGGLAAGFTAIRTEIESGPNRAIERLSNPDGWVIQDGVDNLIEDSYISVSQFNDLQATTPHALVPVTRDFKTVVSGSTARQGMLLSTTLPIDVTQGTGVAPGGVVVSESIAEGLNVSIGDVIDVGGLTLNVKGIVEGGSSFGKEVVFLDPADMVALIGSGYTIVGVVEGAIDDQDLPDGLQYLTNGQFQKGNIEYWRSNASPLVNQVIQIGTFFGAVALFLFMMIAVFMSRKTMLTLRAIGATNLQVWLSEVMVLAVIGALSTLVIFPVGQLLVQQANQVSPGFDAALTPQDLLVGCQVSLGILLTASVSIFIYLRHASRKLASGLSTS